MPVFALAQEANVETKADIEAEQKALPESDPVAIDAIQVTGLRASVLKSINEKHDAEIVSDGISSEALGRFPDANVADSLQHIPGVNISRTHGGEGQYVGVRGLSEAYSVVTLNGRILASDSDGRAFAFDVLPSEMISGADILKTSRAMAQEGSIGGGIELISARAFDYKGMQSSVSIEGAYNDLSEENGYKASGVFSNTFADDTMGFLISASYADGSVRSDSLGEMYFNSDVSFDANKDGITSPDETGLVTPCCYSTGSFYEQKKRTGLTAAFQWRPNDKIEMTFDGIYSRLDSPAVGYTQSYYIDASLEDDGNGNLIAPTWDDVVLDHGVVTSLTVHDLVPELVTRNEDRVVDTYQLGWNTKFTASDTVTLASDIYWSKSERNSGGKNTWLVAGAAIPGTTGVFSLNRNGLPNMSIQLGDGRDFSELVNDDYSPHYAGLYGDDLSDEIFGAMFDGNWAIDHGVLSVLRFGLSYTDRNKVRTTKDNLGFDCQYCGYPYTFASVGVHDVLHPANVPNFMSGVSGNFPRSFNYFDVAAYFRGLQAADGTPTGAVDENGDLILDENGNPQVYNSSLTINTSINPVQSYDITEQNFAAYMELGFQSEKWYGNAGLRLVNTKTNSKSAINEILSITDNGPAATDGYTVVYSNATPVSDSGHYTKLLPSFNLIFNLTDDSLLRLSAAQVISRPSLAQLAPTRTDNALNGEFIINYDGDAGLKPIEATQADLSYEWYYAPKSALSAAVFWKDISNFIVYQTEYGIPIAGQLFDITSPVNGDSAKIYGVELSITHFWDNGFGIYANYTYTNGSSVVDGVQYDAFEGLSQDKYSAALIYEKGPWSAQLAGDYSGQYVAALYSAIPGVTATGEDLLWVTASLGYTLDNGLAFTLQAQNLNDEPYRVYNGRPDLVTGFETWGRTYTMTVSYQF